MSAIIDANVAVGATSFVDCWEPGDLFPGQTSVGIHGHGEFLRRYDVYNA